MTYPINEQEFTGKWLGAIGRNDNGDRELAASIVQAINRAYNAGLDDGKKVLAPAQVDVRKEEIDILPEGNSDSRIRYADKIDEILREADQKAVKEIYYFVQGYVGGGVKRKGESHENKDD